jgi:hypothetical protein
MESLSRKKRFNGVMRKAVTQLGMGRQENNIWLNFFLLSASKNYTIALSPTGSSLISERPGDSHTPGLASSLPIV